MKLNLAYYCIWSLEIWELLLSVAWDGCPGHPHRIDIERFLGVCSNTGQSLPGWGAALLKWTLGVLAESKLNVSQQLALAIKKASSILGCTSRSAASRSRKVITSLCSACVKTASGTLCTVLGHQHEKVVDKLQIQQKATTMVWVEAPPPWGEAEGARLGQEMALGPPKGNLACTYGKLMEKTGPSWSLVQCRRMAYSGYTLKQQKFKLVTRKSFSPLRHLSFGMQSVENLEILWCLSSPDWIKLWATSSGLIADPPLRRWTRHLLLNDRMDTRRIRGFRKNQESIKECCPLSRKAELEDRKLEVSGISLILIDELLWWRSLHWEAIEPALRVVWNSMLQWPKFPTGALGERDMQNPHPTLGENWSVRWCWLTIRQRQMPLKKEIVFVFYIACYVALYKN